jgi:hypothetical protein
MERMPEYLFALSRETGAAGNDGQRRIRIMRFAEQALPGCE